MEETSRELDLYGEDGGQWKDQPGGGKLCTGHNTNPGYNVATCTVSRKVHYKTTLNGMVREYAH